jgi:hypothetical protein
MLTVMVEAAGRSGVACNAFDEGLMLWDAGGFSRRAGARRS